MKILYSIIFVIAVITTINAQTNTAESLSWKGVIIDVSSVDDVITKFGKPEKEETERLDILNTKSNPFTQNVYKKEWRVLKYKEIEQAANVRFGFDKDNKLIFIKFNPPLKDRKKLINVQAFLKSFENINFKPKVKLFSPPSQYILFGKQSSGYLLAEVSRTTGLFERKSIFDTKTIEDVSNDNLDGIIIEVQFISKSLENNDNTDILK